MKIIRQQGASNERSVEIDDENVVVSELLVYLERDANASLLRKLSYPLTDDTWCQFIFQGQRFDINSPMATLWITSDGPVPNHVWDDLECWLERYETRSLPWKLFAVARCLFLRP